tara:strand:+ start:3712 stop:4203 length:492 start_codon:yes stop_codon:yes gene_type:complete
MEMLQILMLENILLFVHLVGMVVLFGTAATIGLFMFWTHVTADPSMMAHVTSVAVRADAFLTAPAMALQLLSGIALARLAGVPLIGSWVTVALGIFAFVVVHWLPMVFIQVHLRDMARVARDTGASLDRSYRILFRIWVILGCGGFAGLLVLSWVMVAKPDIF